MNVNARLRACLFALAWVLALGLSGCGSDDEKPGSTSSMASSTSPPESAADPESYRSVENGVTTQTSANGVLGDEHLMDAAPGEYLIKFKPRTAAMSAQRTLSKVALQSTKSYKSVTGLHLVKLAPGVDAQNALATYRSSPEVEYIEPNYRYRSLAVPNDPGFGTQWGLHNTGQTGGLDGEDIDAPEAWDITTGSSDVVIAVIDSGVDYNHPDLAANMFRNAAECTPDGVDSDGNLFVDDCYGVDTMNFDTDPMDDNGHGTAVAGVLGAVGNNGIGVAGVAWNVKILPCKYSNEAGYGLTSTALGCFDYVAEMKARGVNIVATNNSWGNTLPSRALEDAIREQMNHGILTIAAAGNSGMDNDRFPSFPCAYYVPNVICVAALNNRGYLAEFSNRGRATVHLGAPGEDLPSTALGGTYVLFSGTSAASPVVAGMAALVAAQSPGRDWRAIKNLILAGTINERHETLSGGVLVAGMDSNAYGALSCNNSVIARRLRPIYRAVEEAQIVSAVGVPIELSVQHIDCAAPNGPISVPVQPGGEIVTLLDNGLGKDAAANDGIYTAAWVPSAGGEFQLTFPGDDVVEITIDPLLEPGFPVKTPHTAGTYASGNAINVLVGNIDSDPELELLASALASGPLYAWNADGTEQPGWPTLDGWNGAAYAVLGEFDRSVAGSEVFTTHMFGGRSIVYGNGLSMPGWPRDGGSGGVPMAADLNGDGVDEILSPGALTVDGSLLSPDGGGPSAKGLKGAIADLDGDGDLEVVDVVSEGGISQGSTMRARHHDGREMFLRSFPNMSISGNAVIGDVDGDGAVEIVVLTFDGYPWHVTVRILSADGVEERNVLLPNTTNTSASAELALADLDGDGIPEIVAHGAQLHVLKGDATVMSGWPAYAGLHGPKSPPVIGDLTGDGLPEVVALCHSLNICIFERDGKLLPGFPKLLRMMGSGGVPAIADLDLDGRNELIVVGAFWNGFSGWYDKLWVYDLGGPAASGPIEWGQYKGGPQRQGFYELGKNLAAQAYLTAHVRGIGTIAAQDGGILCGADCIELYNRGSMVTLTATEGSGQRFYRWLGACAGQSNPCTIAIHNYTSVLAEFSGPPELTVAVEGPGSGAIVASTGSISCPADCTDSYVHGTTVTLTASPAAGSYFSHWSGACSGSAPTCALAMNEDLSATAHFGIMRTLNVTSSSDGAVTSSPAGIQCGADCTEDYRDNTIVTLTATADSGAVFSGWSGACSGRSSLCMVTMNAARSVTARFTRQYTLQIGVQGDGVGRVNGSPGFVSCVSSCNAIYDPGTLVTLTASAGVGHRFTGWSGACSGSGSACAITMDQAKAVTATFIRLTQLQVSLEGNGSGMVRSEPYGIICGGDCLEFYTPGSVVTLTATATTGSAFVGWSGPCAGNMSTCVVTLNQQHLVTATFNVIATPEPSRYPLQVAVVGMGSGTVTSAPAGISCGADCAESYIEGAQVTLTPAANPGSLFIGWSGACTGTAPCVLTMNGAVTVRAEFTSLLPLNVSVSGAGTVTSNPSGIDCPADCSESLRLNAAVELTATPAAGQVFDSWGGACSSQTAASCTVILDSAKNVTVTFRPAPPVNPPQQPEPGGNGGSTGGGGSGGGSSGGGGGGGNVGALLLAALSTLALARNRRLRKLSAVSRCDAAHLRR